MSESNPSSIPVNPNVAKAKRRGGPRPKSTNQTAEQLAKGGLRWIEPLPNPVPIPTDFDPFAENEFAGDFTLDFQLPSVIAEPYTELLDGLVYRTTGDQELAARMIPAVRGLTHFKTAQKLYGTSTADVQTSLQPLKGVWYDDLEVPDSMARLIDTVGNFDSKLGKFKVRYPRHTFWRWVAEGLRQVPDLSEHPAPGANDGVPENWIWPDPEGLDIISNLAESEMDDVRSVTHQLTIGPEGNTTNISCSLPAYTDENAQRVGAFPANVRTRWARVGLCSRITLDNLRNNTTPAGTEPAVDLTTLLSAIGLARRPDSYGIVQMRDSFNRFQQAFRRRIAPHMSAYFKLSPPPKTDRGYAAQLAQSDDRSVSCILPLSDADMAMGFLLDPVDEWNLEPKITAYSKVNRATARAEAALSSAKSIAH